jgi:hypothetical protein
MMLRILFNARDCACGEASRKGERAWAYSDPHIRSTAMKRRAVRVRALMKSAVHAPQSFGQERNCANPQAPPRRRKYFT